LLAEVQVTGADSKAARKGMNERRNGGDCGGARRGLNPLDLNLYLDLERRTSVNKLWQRE